MSTVKQYELEGIDLTDNHYTVQQNLARNQYEAVDTNGDTVLQARQELFKFNEELPFVNDDGENVFTVKAQQSRDYEGQFVLLDTQTDEPVVVLDREYSLFEQVSGITWKIRDAETEATLAEITSRKYVGMFRTGLLKSMLPRKYEIIDADGTPVGSIAEKFSLQDRYEVEIEDASAVPKEPVVAAAMVIDAIEGH